MHQNYKLNLYFLSEPAMENSAFVICSPGGVVTESCPVLSGNRKEVLSRQLDRPGQMVSALWNGFQLRAQPGVPCLQEFEAKLSLGENFHPSQQTHHKKTPWQGKVRSELGQQLVQHCLPGNLGVFHNALKKSK